jgi:Mce-associated membrane protein
MTVTPDRPGWYPDPLKPATQERRWDGADWTDDVREASEATRAQRASRAAVVEEVAQQPSRDQVTDAGTEPDDGHVQSGRTTMLLVLAIVVLVGVALLQAAYLWGPLEDDPTVSSDRPVLLSRAAERSATETAAKAAVAFAQRSHETYDEQVDEAAAMMTADFEKQFRQTTDDARDRFIEAETQVTAEVAAQGVMTASEQQVEALIFLNQFTLRKGEESVFTPFRLKVTLIDTEQGWLVSDVEAT